MYLIPTNNLNLTRNQTIYRCIFTLSVSSNKYLHKRSKEKETHEKFAHIDFVFNSHVQYKNYAKIYEKMIFYCFLTSSRGHPLDVKVRQPTHMDQEHFIVNVVSVMPKTTTNSIETKMAR